MTFFISNLLETSGLKKGILWFWKLFTYSIYIYFILFIWGQVSDLYLPLKCHEDKLLAEVLNTCLFYKIQVKTYLWSRVCSSETMHQIYTIWQIPRFNIFCDFLHVIKPNNLKRFIVSFVLFILQSAAEYISYIQTAQSQQTQTSRHARCKHSE